MAVSQFSDATLRDEHLRVQGRSRKMPDAETLSIEVAVIQENHVARGTVADHHFDTGWGVNLPAAEFAAGPAVAIGIAVMFNRYPPAFQTFCWSDAIKIKQGK